MDETDFPGEKPKFSLPPHLIGTVAANPFDDIPTGRKTPVKRVSLEGKVGSRVDSTKYRGNGHWMFEEPMGDPIYTGFIYLIHDRTYGKLYLGKKQYRGHGKENRGQDSNWRWYISSSKEVSASIKQAGKENFEFVALEQYHSKGALSYAETWSLLHVESPVNRDLWYNLLINKVSWVVKEPITARHKQRLKRAIEIALAKDTMENL